MVKKMKKYIFTVLISLVSLSVSCQTKESNIKFNLNFDDVLNGKPQGWYAAAQPGYSVSLDSVNVQSGKYSVVIEFIGESGNFQPVTFGLPNNYDGQQITLSGYIKTENVRDGYAGLWMRIDPQIAFDNMQQRGITGTTDWTKYEITLPMNPSKTTQIVLGGLLVGKGKMWLDNFSISIDGKDVSEAKVFEKPPLSHVQSESHSQLSTEQKIQDFEFLCQTLKENYPFFDVAKRQSNTDWLSKKDVYLEKIKNTPNDLAYLMTVASFVNELRSPHLSAIIETSRMLDVYKRAIEEKPKYAKWAEVLEKSKEQSYRWQKTGEDMTGHKSQTSQEQRQVIYYSDSLLVEDKIAIMRIKSFFYDNLANDSVQITSFLKKIQDYEYLIIDIQDNNGGSSNYWKNYIVGKISATSIPFPRHQVAKNGSLNRHFYPDIEKWQIATKQNTFFPNMPNEILNGSYYLNTSTDTVIPNNPIPFRGKIFVLVNEWVVSASDDFAYFCKASKWATVAGICTMGDGGNIAEPTLFMLPNSGIVITHPSVVGLNEDGSFNFETRTTPDIEIEAKNSNERLERLIKKITSGK